MKNVKIYSRKVLERTGCRKYPYKEVTEYTVICGLCEFKNHYHDMNDKRLKIPFILTYECGDVEELNKYISNLSRKKHDKWLRDILEKIKG